MNPKVKANIQGSFGALIGIICIVCLCLIGKARGEETNADFTANASVGFANKYVGPSGNMYKDSPVIQPSLTVAYKNGLYASAWGSLGICEGLSDEVDYLLGWAGKVGGLDADIGAGYYDFTKMFHGRSGNAWAVYGKVSHDIELPGFGGTMTPYVRLEGDIADKDTDWSGGWLATVGQHYSKEFHGLKPWADASLSYDNGTYDYDVTTTFQYKLGFDWNIHGVKVTPNALLSVPSAENQPTEFVWGVNASHDF